jgi:chemotaxis protein methyltransferase CheR
MHTSPIRSESAAAMSLIAGLLEQRTGQEIAANRSWRIETALKPIMRAHSISSLDQLVAELVVARNNQLADTVVDALLNQETSFFRDTAVLDALLEAARHLQAEHAGRRLRIWCAGCSTGQEPLSLAMLFDERGPELGITPPEIIATDVSGSAIARARAGRYSQFEIQRGLPVRRMIAWFEGTGGEWVAKPELVRRIHFRQHNLVEDLPPVGRFDIVLCRNVLLYFSQPLRRRVFDTLGKAVRPGGMLVLGAGETVIGQTDVFAPSDRFRGFYHPASAKR